MHLIKTPKPAPPNLAMLLDTANTQVLYIPRVVTLGILHQTHNFLYGHKESALEMDCNQRPAILSE